MSKPHRQTEKREANFFPTIRHQMTQVEQALHLNSTKNMHGDKATRRPNEGRKGGKSGSRKALPNLPRGKPAKSNMESRREQKNRMERIREIVADPEFQGKGSLAFYKIGQLIGQGAFGKVYRGWHRISGQELAIKAYPLSALRQKEFRKAVRQETKLLQRVCHPGIIALYEVIQEKKSLYIITEYACGGSLKGLLRRKKSGGEYTEGSFEEPEARRLFQQVAAAVAYMHHENIIHRDLKLENVLLDLTGYCKILDLGFSVTLKPGKRLRERCGTVVFMAPELIEVGSNGYSFPVDIWAMGCILYQMLAGKYPFRPTSIYDMKKNMQREKLDFPSAVSPEAQDLVFQMLRYNEAERITADQVLMHPWFTADLSRSVWAEDGAGGEAAAADADAADRPRTRHLSLVASGSRGSLLSGRASPGAVAHRGLRRPKSGTSLRGGAAAAAAEGQQGA
eukprot:CAMPEP_0206383562 /NCGR_PEP_ID=MMETSP0294-20121207/14019_1 /ASSEMBLY_ACC=CAM_ASM_000327 /TAXON_ID=39354 /ORGANISM="Heterosigma akashiwo, Strain CCMP2393" /LENGTH=451 /DNA_ID=CAMNT_0053833637 /DNA_START=119 /DNA_END=1471 /DNA_ORIENTATION=+